jgi:hypothetical protein
MENFNKRTFGALSNGIAILKKIFNSPKNVVVSKEVIDKNEEIIIEEVIFEEPIVEEVVSEEPITVSEEKPKKGRKKKSE